VWRWTGLDSTLMSYKTTHRDNKVVTRAGRLIVGNRVTLR